MSVKVNSVQKDARSALRKYRDLYYGDLPAGKALQAELILAFAGGLPGAFGLWLRSKLYPALLGAAGRGVVFGRNVTLRHPHKIRLGNNVIIDDNAVLDAKGDSNRGIVIGDNVYVGRNTIVYCKNGDIVLESHANVSANCQLFSANRLTVGEGTVIGAFTYLLSGGEYDYASPVPFAEQSGKPSRGALAIGPNCWLGCHVTVVDAASIGAHCVIGAGAVVTRPIEANRMAVGVPARVVKSIGEGQ
jgi:acetyltransferase-like isoleucine patch superfamily enzyme